MSTTKTEGCTVGIKPEAILVLPKQVVIATSSTGRAYFQKRTKLNDKLYRKHLVVSTVKKERGGFLRVTFVKIQNSFRFGQQESCRLKQYILA